MVGSVVTDDSRRWDTVAKVEVRVVDVTTVPDVGVANGVAKGAAKAGVASGVGGNDPAVLICRGSERDTAAETGDKATSRRGDFPGMESPREPKEKPVAVDVALD
jgi:hypothetical protein